MEPIKIMPCLDMKNGRVVKGVHFVDIREAGDPVENAVFYQAEGADELAMLDIAATLENRKTRLEWVKKVSAQISIPLTVGGGISSLEDIEMVLGAGASKVSMNSAAVKNPELVRLASAKFGPEKITVAIDAKRNPAMSSGFELVVSGGTLPIAKDAVAWARQCQELGAGVILPPAWTATAQRRDTIFPSPKRFPPPSACRWWRPAARENWRIFTKRLWKEALLFCWLRPFFISGCSKFRMSKTI